MLNSVGQIDKLWKTIKLDNYSRKLKNKKQETRKKWVNTKIIL